MNDRPQTPGRQAAQVNHWCRVVMNRSTSAIVSSLRPESLDALEISGTAWAGFGFRSYHSVDFPSFDICSQRLPRTFDLIIAEQVFEHIRRPSVAAQNVLAMLNDGGMFLITTPFLIKYHPSPSDLWRWTSEGLRALLEDAGFHVLVAEQWGNRACVAANLDFWPMYDPQRHTLENERDFPLVVWALATRASSKREMTGDGSV